MLEAVGGGQWGDLPCYRILKCAVCSSSPIYKEDKRGTERLAGLRLAREIAIASLAENHPQDFADFCKSLLWKGG